MEQSRLIRRSFGGERAIVLIQVGGAVERVKPDATAYWNRRAQYNMELSAAWDDRSQGARNANIKPARACGAERTRRLVGAVVIRCREN